MRKLNASLHLIDCISEWAGKITSFGIVLIIGIIIWSVVLRYGFHVPTVWDWATASKIFFIYIFFGAAYVLHSGAHVNVDILHKRLSLKMRSIVDLVTFTFFFLFCIALLWGAIEMAIREAPRTYLSLGSFLPPAWPITLLAPVGIFLFLLQGLAKFIRYFIIAISGKEAM